jgi:hypothetical protein
MVRASQ